MLIFMLVSTVERFLQQHAALKASCLYRILNEHPCSSSSASSPCFLTFKHLLRLQVEDLQTELEKETSRRYTLEQVNEELQDQLASLKGTGRNNGELERSKRHLENEVRELRRQLENIQPDQSVLDQYRREAEEKAHQEMQQKLDQVNLFLQVKS